MKKRTKPKWYSKPEFSNWAKPRGYSHFDVPVGETFARRVMRPTTGPSFVEKHAFSPLIHYVKVEPRYKKTGNTVPDKNGKLVDERVVVPKERPIKYASHRDACIHSWYAHELNRALEAQYAARGLGEKVVAYRPLGRSNYHFSADALAFAKAHSPAMILAFDVSGFFDTLDHARLKQRLKEVLGVPDLAPDWLRVFKNVTRFHYVDLEELKAHPAFAARFDGDAIHPIATVAEMKAEGISFHQNPEVAAGRRRGIPQGTPISAALSNLSMLEFDTSASAFCDGIGAFYRRYSDDILVICQPADATAVESEIMRLIELELLEIQPAKTEKTLFDASSALGSAGKAAQYLGFTLSENGPAIRETSLARQWRKFRRAIRRTRRIAEKQIANGRADRAYTKRLIRRFSHMKVFDGESTRALRNFSSYARRSAEAFGEGEKISQQVKKLERAARTEIAALKALGKKP